MAAVSYGKNAGAEAKIPQSKQGGHSRDLGLPAALAFAVFCRATAEDKDRVEALISRQQQPQRGWCIDGNPFPAPKVVLESTSKCFRSPMSGVRC